MKNDYSLGLAEIINVDLREIINRNCANKNILSKNTNLQKNI